MIICFCPCPTYDAAHRLPILLGYCTLGQDLLLDSASLPVGKSDRNQVTGGTCMYVWLYVSAWANPTSVKLSFCLAFFCFFYYALLFFLFCPSPFGPFLINSPIHHSSRRDSSTRASKLRCLSSRVPPPRPITLSPVLSSSH